MADETAPPSGKSDDLAAAYTAEADASAARIADDPRRPTFLWRVLSGWLVRVESWLGARGGRPLRRAIRVFWAVIALGGIVLLIGPVINPPLTLDDVTKSADTLTERWIARDFKVHYTLEREANGQLSTRVVERIDAFFPATVDESGIQRVLATDYEGHDLGPTGISATLDGSAVRVGRNNTPTQLTLSMDAGHRLSGDHIFVIHYKLHDLAYPAQDDATGKNVDLLNWDVFGPSWPQAFAELTVSVTMPTDLNDRLIRRPQGEIAYLIAGSSKWLTPETSVPGQVSYSFHDKQNLPPHSNAGFFISFEPGTFTMPPHDTLWWIQTFGPLVPLVLLILTLLLSLAARAVAWGDANGRPWYVAQYDPPPGVSPRLAAELLRSVGAMELASALQAERAASGQKRRALLFEAARIARRAGRVGDGARAYIGYLAAGEHREVLDRGWRRVPRGFVRDTFIAAPIALTLVQFGLVRQLSYQVTLAIVWWPALFVLASLVISVIVFAIALSARPLTDNGALVKQYLLGIREYVTQTNLFERATLTDKLLPYAVLVLPARQAGRKVVELVRTQLGEDAAPEGQVGWYLTPPRLLIRILAPLAVVAAIVVVSAVPVPSAGTPDYVSYDADLPGTASWSVDSAAFAAKLNRTDSGRARLAVSEKLAVTFVKKSAEIPEFIQQWPDGFGGQSVHVKVSAITVDGAPVPFTVRHEQGTTLALTQIVDPLVGKHALVVDYALTSAALAANGNDGTVDRVRWDALVEGWDSGYGWNADERAVSPLTVSLTIPNDLADKLKTPSGWLGADGSVPFGNTKAATRYDEGKAIETTTTGAGGTTHTLSLAADDNGIYPFDLTLGGLGSVLDFPAGTFRGPDGGALHYSQFASLLPSLSSIFVGLLALIIAAVGIVGGARRRPRVFATGPVRDLIQILGPALALTSVILFGWASAHLFGNEPQFAPMIIVALLSIPASIAAIALVRRSRAVG